MDYGGRQGRYGFLQVLFEILLGNRMQSEPAEARGNRRHLRTEPPGKLNVVYHLYSIDHGHRVRVKVPLPENHPEVDTVSTVWKTANWWERETFDMFGINFDGANANALGRFISIQLSKRW